MEIKRKRKVYGRQNTEPNLFDDNDFEENDDRKRLNLFNSFYNSSIIKEIKDIYFIYSLFQDNYFMYFKLIYRMSYNQGPTLSIFKIQVKQNSQNIRCIFGCYNSLYWDSSNSTKDDKSAFIFSVTHKKIFPTNNPQNSIVCCKDFGPSFGYQNDIKELCTAENKGYYNSTDTFGDINRFCTNGQKEFIILDLEVYKILFN